MAGHWLRGSGAGRTGPDITPRQHAARRLALLATVLSLAGCGVFYQSSTVPKDGDLVDVVPITAETLSRANASPYRPRALPAIFDQTAGGQMRIGAALPEPPSGGGLEPAALPVRLPPPVEPGPYRIGVGDVVTLVLPGRNGETGTWRTAVVTVQDDGAILTPETGRVPLAGLTLPDAEQAVFSRLVDVQANPNFSLDVTGFNSARVAVGGAVGIPGNVPLTLVPLYLDEALAAAGGAAAAPGEAATALLFRGTELYSVPLDVLYGQGGGQRIPLLPGDSVYVDTATDLDQAQSFFTEQIELGKLRNEARQVALQELNTVVNLQRAALEEARGNFQARLDLDAVPRDFFYLTGEVARPGGFPLPFDRGLTLADALFGQGGGLKPATGNPAQIYVLREAETPGSVTAWNLDARNAAGLVLATRFEMRPNDVVFVAEQPITRWNRLIEQITPALITTSLTQATD